MWGVVGMSADQQSFELAPGKHRVALGVEYAGARYCGWQTQLNPARMSVQETLERALARVADHPVSVSCAGRTDAGVSASGQVVHFDCRHERPLVAWVKGVNSHLPDDISVRWSIGVPGDFHARFSAFARRYRYFIYNAPVRSAVAAGRFTWHPYPLDAERMHEDAQHLIGELDFSSFRAAGCQSRTPMRNVHSISVQRAGDLVVIDVTANAFLHHMVRNIAGVLIAVGAGRQSPGWTREVLTARDRKVAAVTAPPDGLYLVDVSYPDAFGLPRPEPGPVFYSGLGFR